MKKNILFLLAAVALLASCLDDSEANQVPVLTQEQKDLWITLAGGSYFGNISITDEDKNTNTAPFDFYITARDSTLTCENFPLSLIAKYINDEKDALTQAPKLTYEGVLHPFYAGFAQDYSYYFDPKATKIEYKFNHEEREYNVALNFATHLASVGTNGVQTSVYPIAVKNQLSAIFSANVLIKSVVINGQEQTINKVAVITGYPEDRYNRDEKK